MNESETKDSLREFITSQLLIGESAVLDDDDELLLDGIIDSLGVTRVIGFIRDQFGIVIPREEATVENFRTVSILVSYLNRKTTDISASS